mmetsp:Transcript_1585/g.2435  ORF Transcript_1585/g.2435 Transcript_1585/m.2435 type:complete len:207 (-) Transcript_1585:44-664(-)
MAIQAASFDRSTGASSSTSTSPLATAASRISSSLSTSRPSARSRRSSSRSSVAILSRRRIRPKFGICSMACTFILGMLAAASATRFDVGTTSKPNTPLDSNGTTALESTLCHAASSTPVAGAVGPVVLSVDHSLLTQTDCTASRSACKLDHASLVAAGTPPPPPPPPPLPLPLLLLLTIAPAAAAECASAASKSPWYPDISRRRAK